MTALGVAPPPAGGIDLSLPGADVRLGATRWPGDGTPIVLLHGLASQRRFWNLVVPHLVGVGPLLAVDQRGHGDSDRPDDGYDLDTVALDLATAMDAVGWSRAVVVGHSWGGAVAATFAAKHPERTLALVAIDGGFTSPRAMSDDRAAVRKRLEPPRFAMPPEDLVAMIRGNAPGGRWTEEAAAAVLPIFEIGSDGLARARLPFDKHMAIVVTLLDYDPRRDLDGVRSPTWLVSCEGTADEDEFTVAKVAGMKELAGRLPDCRILRWGGAIHDVPLQWPALVAGLIRTAAAEVG